jgi:hypothetical protein
MVKIRKIKYWDHDKYNADVYLSDGRFYCKAFFYSLDIRLREGDILTEPIGAFFSLDPVIKTSKDIGMKYVGDEDGYLVVGELVDIGLKIVKVGDFLIDDIGFISSDISLGDKVEFLTRSFCIDD